MLKANLLGKVFTFFFSTVRQQTGFGRELPRCFQDTLLDIRRVMKWSLLIYHILGEMAIALECFFSVDVVFSAEKRKSWYAGVKCLLPHQLVNAQ